MVTYNSRFNSILCTKNNGLFFVLYILGTRLPFKSFSQTNTNRKGYHAIGSSDFGILAVFIYRTGYTFGTSSV